MEIQDFSRMPYDLTVVTRNTKDMEISGAILHNPWKNTHKPKNI